jgi:hypothetical protein
MTSKNRYRSKFEARIASALKGAGASFDYETLRLKYIRECVYTPDFIMPNGIIIECNSTLDLYFKTLTTHSVKEAKPHTPIGAIRTDSNGHTIAYQKNG